MKRRKPQMSVPSTSSTSGSGTGKNWKHDKEIEIKKGMGKVKKGSFEHRFERRRYLTQLVDEFSKTTAMECKQQVLANLANFAYDPYNYHFFQEIGVVPVFLAELSVNRNEILTEYAMAGVCNCVADRRIQKEILRKDGLPILKRHAYSSSIPTLISALTTLITFLYSGHHELKGLILADNFHNHLTNDLLTYQDKRVQNVAQVLLDVLQ